MCRSVLLVHSTAWSPGVCRITPADEGQREIQDRLRKVGEAHLHAKSGLCIR